MINLHLKKSTVLGCLFLFSLVLRGQDIHFSQYAPSYLNVSPSLAGSFDGSYRFSADYRAQWTNVPVNYRTLSIAGDMPILKKNNNLVGLGIIFFQDAAGDSRLTSTLLNISISYSRKLNQQHSIGIGFNSGVGQRRFKIDDLRFDEQYKGDAFNPANATFENFTNTTFLYLDTGLGLHYKFAKSERDYVQVSSGWWHLNKPQYGFDNSIEIFRKAIFQVESSIKINPKMDLLIHSTAAFQGPYREVLTGVSSRYHLNLARGVETWLAVGTTYRVGDALIPGIRFRYQSWEAGFSYDFNTSQFVRASLGLGGPELSLIYILKKVNRLPLKFSCPIFF